MNSLSDKPARPNATGSAMDLSTDPTVPKPRATIEIVEAGGSLTLSDRKLFNVLLHHSWQGLADEASELPNFKAATADLRRAIGEEAHHDNQRLRESFDRLMTVRVVFPYLSSDGTVKQGASPLLAFRAVPKGGGTAEWAFPQHLRKVLAAPAAWARIHLQVSAKFTSKYGLTLYELLSAFVNLRDPTWRVEVDDLQTKLGVKSATAAKNFAYFQREMLDRALREVNEFSPLEAAYSCERAPTRGRPVTHVIFTVRKKAGGDLLAVARATEFAADPLGSSPRTAAGRDQATIDLEDGRTDAERPQVMMALANRITAAEREAIEREFPGVNVDDLVNRWATWAAAQGKLPSNPALAFRGFVKKAAAEHGQQPTAITLSVTGTAAKLPAKLRRAVDRIAAMTVMERQALYKQAREAGAPTLKAATAVDNLPKWVSFLPEEAVP